MIHCPEGAKRGGGTSPPVVKELSRADGCPLHPMIMISDGPTRVKPGPLGHRQRRHGLDPRRSAGSSASIGCKGRSHRLFSCPALRSSGLKLPYGALRIVKATATHHGAGDFQQPVTDRAQGPAVGMAGLSQGLVARLAGGVALDRDAAPVIHCVAQTLAAGLTHQHDTTLAAASGYRRHSARRA
jgi:hypothetical protein